tara:strand:+ start:6388 stop:6840 length:453 start_codon:yes stop_codon:yes gene_type:complete
MNKFIGAIVLYAALWLIFAVFGTSPFSFNTIVDYRLMPSPLSTGDQPENIRGGITKYRIDGQIVIAQINDFPPVSYKDCSVMDIENWNCRYEDGSGQFGLKDGDYYAIPHFGPERFSVSRFRYVMNHVHWLWIEEDPLVKATILFIPFFI